MIYDNRSEGCLRAVSHGVGVTEYGEYRKAMLHLAEAG
jgi:hypothetical protein